MFGDDDFIMMQMLHVFHLIKFALKVVYSMQFFEKLGMGKYVINEPQNPKCSQMQ